MARTKRPYGTGEVYREGRGWAMRWREEVVDKDGKRRSVRRYELLTDVTKTEVEEMLRQRLVRAVADAKALDEATGPSTDARNITFEEHVETWKRERLPGYKFSTRKVHGSILENHLVPHFGKMKLSEITNRNVQAYVTALQQRKFAPATIDQHHQVISDVLRSAVKWYGMPSNPARGVEMPAMVSKREKWALSVLQATQLVQRLPLKARAMVLLCLTSGIRRGELFALRWKHLNEKESTISVVEAVYCGQFDKPKTRNSVRIIPLAEPVLELLREWKRKAKKTGADDLIFGTRKGKPEHSTNVLRRYIQPACSALKLPPASWLTFRRTFSTWSHYKGVSSKTVAELMGHSNVRTQFIYIQGVDEEKRRAAELLAGELARIGQKTGENEVKLVN